MRTTADMEAQQERRTAATEYTSLLLVSHDNDYNDDDEWVPWTPVAQEEERRKNSSSNRMLRTATTALAPCCLLLMSLVYFSTTQSHVAVVQTSSSSSSSASSPQAVTTAAVWTDEWDKLRSTTGAKNATQAAWQTATRDAENAWSQVEDESETAWQTATHNAENVWSQVEDESATMENASAIWFQSAWETTEQDAHTVWTDVADKEGTWWNKTVTHEHEWFNHTLMHLHKFGGHLQNWWSHERQDATEKEHALDRNFRHWFAHASQEEKIWWNQTVDAARRFEGATENKTHVWWNMTEATLEHHVNTSRHVLQKDWNATRTTEEKWWLASQEWFHKHRVGENDQNDGQVLLYLNSSQAFGMLMNGYGWYDYSSDYFLYQTDVQETQAYCAVATAAAILNSLPTIDTLPVDPVYQPYPYATQDGLLRLSQCVTEKVVVVNDTWDGIIHAPGGLGLAQTRELLQCHLPDGWSVALEYVTEDMEDVVRKEMVAALRDPHSRVLVNYDRSVLGQEGSGHFSPVASYSTKHDAFLVLDVAKYKYPPVWVPAKLLVQSMSTTDSCGEWEFPHAQERLPDQEDMLGLWKSNTTAFLEEYNKSLKTLGCSVTTRGYIVVSMV